jgi:hypothetical protein
MELECSHMYVPFLFRTIDSLDAPGTVVISVPPTNLDSFNSGYLQ